VVVQELRQACQRVAAQARSVRINPAEIPRYAASLPAPSPIQTALLADGEREIAAWYWLTLDAVNFGSGWFPTLRKPPGGTGYSTVSRGLERHFARRGPWSADALARLDAASIAAVLDQDPDHELMARFADSLNDLGRQLQAAYQGNPLQLIRAADHSATELLARVAPWPCFADVSVYAGIDVPFYKRAQILAADLARAGAARWDDLEQLTMFADNLVPHVLRLDGILDFAPDLVARIDAEQLIEHGSAEEVEIRACAAQIDALLWQRGQGSRYKGSPRHRSRSTAY
jgi:hypothetical protein